MKRRAFVWCALASCARPPKVVDAGAARPEPAPDEAAPVARPTPVADPMEARAQALREELAGESFVIRVEPPFVVIGDQSPELVERHSTKTVRWAVDRLREAYFERDPADVIDIWLFGTAAAYERYANERFGGPPSTPYGYFSHEHRALVMNISTGAGTLVHEIVHPLMAANFPECPSWFDEGMASLYEQCGEQDGRIWGYTNWRLAGLQEAIADDGLPPLATLFETGDRPFYDDDPGTNYAQARYLCLWLQEHGLLRDFYREFVAASAHDPSGAQTFWRLVGAENAAARAEWESGWRRWVTALRYE